MDKIHAILTILQDGKFHSGEELASVLNISRTSIWKRVQKLRDLYDIEIFSVTGRGYRLASALKLLDRQRVCALLRHGVPVGKLDVFPMLESTNQYLLERLNEQDVAYDVCLAEMQTAGRGRRGRQWHSPFGQNLYLSISRNFAIPMYRIAGISLVAGVAVAQTLQHYGLNDVALKWPNDIHVGGKKIAGLLVEVRGEAEGPVKVVMGIGINFNLPEPVRRQIDQPVTDLTTQLPSPLPERNHMVATLLKKLDRLILVFEQQGMKTILNHWEVYDSYRDSGVMIVAANQQTDGIYRGINEDGELILETASGMMTFNAGEVSLRKGV